MTKLFSPCKLAIFDGCLIILILSRFLFPTLCYFNSDKTTTLYKSGYYIIYVYIRYTYTQKKTQSGLNDDILVNNKMLNLTVFTHIQIYQQISIHIYTQLSYYHTAPIPFIPVYGTCPKLEIIFRLSADFFCPS